MRAGLREDEIYFTHLVKTQTVDNAPPTHAEIEAYRPVLLDEIARVKPKYIFVFGGEALGHFTGKIHGSKNKGNGAPGIKTLQGQFIQQDGFVVFPLVNPSYIVRMGGVDDNRGGQIERQKFFSIMTRHVNTIRQLQDGQESDTAPEPLVFICRDMDMVRAGIAELDKCEVLAFDVETQGLRFEPHKTLRILAMSGDGNRVWVFPIEHAETADDIKAEMEWVKAEIGRLLSTRKTIAQRAQFDLNWLRSHGIPCRATFDTKYACHLLDENVSSALKGKTDAEGKLTGAPGQVEMYLHVKPGYALDMSTSDVFEHTLEDLGTYGGKDAAYTWRLREFHIERFRKFPKLARFFKYVTMPGTELLTQIEFNGFPVDVEWIAETMGTNRVRIAEIEKRFAVVMEDGGCGAWDCDSSTCVAQWDWQTDDLIQMLYDVAGIPVMKRTEAKGQASANDEAMIDVKAEFVRLLVDEPENEDFQAVVAHIDLVREWGDLTKDLAFMESWGKFVWADGRIHSTYHWEMSTGRTSCRDPNAQQWPKRLKRAVKAREGWTFIAVDESQAELRLIAEDAQEEVMLAIYARDGDIHRTTAAAIMKKPESEVTSKERQKAKPANFGFSFSMGSRRFQQYARYDYGVYLDIQECDDFRKAFFATYPDLAPWHNRVRAQCKDNGYVETFMGRRRRPDKIWSPNREEAAMAMRQAINAIPQGGASDLTIYSGCQMPLDPATILPVIFVHDSFLFETRKDMVAHWAGIIKDVMENKVKDALQEQLGVELKVPLRVDIRVKDTWDMGDEDTLEKWLERERASV
jgi:DNA polymerase-1